jgi:hypothetical protein
MTDKLVVDFPQGRDLDSTFLSRQQLRAVTFNLKATTVHQFEEEVKTDDEDSSDTAFWYSDEETRAFKRRTMRSVLIYRLLVEAGQDLRLLQNDCIQGVENFISPADFARGVLVSEQVVVMHVMLWSAFAARSLLDCARMYFRQPAFPLTFGSISLSSHTFSDQRTSD